MSREIKFVIRSSSLLRHTLSSTLHNNYSTGRQLKTSRSRDLNSLPRVRHAASMELNLQETTTSHRMYYESVIATSLNRWSLGSARLGSAGYIRNLLNRAVLSRFARYDSSLQRPSGRRNDDSTEARSSPPMRQSDRQTR